MKAVVLCGGLGSRLGALTAQTPKPMLPVAGRPFIDHVMDRLVAARLDTLIMAAGFEWQKLRDHIGGTWRNVPVRYSVESTPLGTGGAIKAAMAGCAQDDILVVNGDTLFDIDLDAFMQFASSQNAQATIALRSVEDCARYGRVTVDAQHKLLSFGEKGHHGPGQINGGIYFLKAHALDGIQSESFSFETEFLATRHSQQPIYGLAFDSYFIDIGIPADLQRAQIELQGTGQK